MDKILISENEIPYEELAGFGLTQEMIDDFPESVMDRFLSGQRTPLLPIERADQDGVIYNDYARIRLVENNGEIHPVFLPLMGQNNLDEFSEDQKIALRHGGVLKVILPSDNGFSYVQLDQSTNSILSVKADIIDQNLNILTNNLDANEKLGELQDGDVVSIFKDDQIISAGIDLNEETGVRTVEGDAQKWYEDRGCDGLHDKYNFGIYGCWTLGDDGKLAYVPEENYTEDMVVAQEAIVENAKQNRGAHM